MQNNFNVNDFYFHIGSKKPADMETTGKTFKSVCCAPTLKVMEGLIPFNPTEEEFEVFEKCFLNLGSMCVKIN